MIDLVMQLILRIGAVFLLYVSVYAPVHLYHEAKCLEKGYPEARTSVGFTGYCVTVEGAIAAKVEKL